MAKTEKKEKTASTDTKKPSALDEILNQYENNKSNSGDFDKVDLTKYFTDKLQKGVKSDERTIRILPSKDGKSPFAEAYWHEMKVADQWTKMYCNNLNDDKECPLCEAKEALELTGNANDKKLALSYKPKKFYIVKIIDRDNEAEGVKFYRFKHNYKNDGVWDKLNAIFRKYGEIYHPREGRDVTLTMNRDQNNFSVVSSILPSDPSMLTNDVELAKLWYNDESTWRDVYRPKNITYLQVVAIGKKPVWDKESKGFVAEDTLKNRESVTLDDEIRTSKSELSKNNKPKFELQVKDASDDDTDNNDDEKDEVETTGGDDMPF